jgi:hypothetical protein
VWRSKGSVRGINFSFRIIIKIWFFGILYLHPIAKYHIISLHHLIYYLTGTGSPIIILVL